LARDTLQELAHFPAGDCNFGYYNISLKLNKTMREGKMDTPQKAPQETQEQRAQLEWKDYLTEIERQAKATGGELRVYDIFDEQGRVKPDARKIKVFPMDRTDTTNLSPAFDGQYVLQWMTTTQMGNMKGGKLINEGQ
jgi:hypothetical protein